MSDLTCLAGKAKDAAAFLARCHTDEKNAALAQIAAALQECEKDILAANQKDLENAAKNGLSESIRDRLRLNSDRLFSIINATKKVAALHDPVGEILSESDLPSGLHLKKVRVPMGVIGIIFEARPNVTVDSAVLCLKAGSAAFLRGGKEAICTNIALEAAIHKGLEKAGFPTAAVTLLHDTDRETAQEMMRLRGFLDLLIPRGGAGLIRTVIENATVPVIETGTGNCHIFVDATAELTAALDIIDNAKTQRVSVCNAAETLLVHEDIAKEFLPAVQKRLSQKNVELRCCERALQILPSATPATEEDWQTEFLDYILAVKVVDSVQSAIRHIARYSSHHSESILTRDEAAAEAFTQAVDSAVVYINTSTRFTDGEEFGFGAEIGISTQKLHARGPMGLAEICSYKYIVKSDGKIR